jgi:hypothetical protein
MSLLTVSARGDGVLVIDSRLIAAELGIQHKKFLATLRNTTLKWHPSQR